MLAHMITTQSPSSAFRRLSTRSRDRSLAIPAAASFFSHSSDLTTARKGPEIQWVDFFFTKNAT